MVRRADAARRAAVTGAPPSRLGRGYRAPRTGIEAEMSGLPTCREVLDFLAAYLGGELAPDVEAAFERHLRACPPCCDYLAGYRETVRLARDAWAEDEPVPDDVPEELVRAILASRGG